MAQLLMPKATAVWLVENTVLTFDQIADFCGLHTLEIQAIADGEVAFGMQGHDPIASGQLTMEEIERCASDPKERLKMAKSTIPHSRARPKGARYTPVSKRQDRPDAISWLIKNCLELSDGQISKLIGTTKPTITAIREKTHWNITNIKPQNPVGLGLCLNRDLEKALALARSRAAARGEQTAEEKAVPAEEKAVPAAEPAPAPATEPAPIAEAEPTGEQVPEAEAVPAEETADEKAESR